MFTRALIAPLGCHRFAVMIDRAAGQPPALVYTGSLEDCRTALRALTGEAGVFPCGPTVSPTDAPATARAA